MCMMVVHITYECVGCTHCVCVYDDGTHYIRVCWLYTPCMYVMMVCVCDVGVCVYDNGTHYLRLCWLYTLCMCV